MIERSIVQVTSFENPPSDASNGDADINSITLEKFSKLMKSKLFRNLFLEVLHRLIHNLLELTGLRCLRSGRHT
jgi:hypothetical protein